MTTAPAQLAWRPTPTVAVTGRSRAAEICTVVFFFVVYTNLAVVLTHYHGVPQVVASSVALLLVVPIVKFMVLERQPFVVTPTLTLMLAFLGALFLAGVLSSDPGVVRASIGTYLSEGLLLFVLVSNAVRTTRMLTLAVWALIAAGSLMGGLSVIQELTHTYDNEYGGLAQVDRFGSGGGFNVAPEGAQEVLRPRLGGPLGSENRYAQIMAVLFPLALVRAFRERSRRLRLTAGAASLLILGGILLTFSRGAAVAVAATLAFMLLVRELRIRHLLVAAGVLVATVAFVVPDYIIRLTSLEEVTALSSSSENSTGPDQSLVGRQTENLAALHAFLDHPVTGVGPGVYFHEYSQEYGNRLGLRYLQSERRGHSLYLEMAADTGIVGLGAFLAMVGTTMALLYRNARYWRERHPERAMLAGSLLCALFAYLASAAFLHLSYQRFFWVVLALASAAIWTFRQEERVENAALNSQPGVAT